MSSLGLLVKFQSIVENEGFKIKDETFQSIQKAFTHRHKKWNALPIIFICYHCCIKKETNYITNYSILSCRGNRTFSTGIHKCGISNPKTTININKFGKAAKCQPSGTILSSQSHPNSIHCGLLININVCYYIFLS